MLKTCNILTYPLVCMSAGQSSCKIVTERAGPLPNLLILCKTPMLPASCSACCFPSAALLLSAPGPTQQEPFSSQTGMYQRSFAQRVCSFERYLAKSHLSIVGGSIACTLHDLAQCILEKHACLWSLVTCVLSLLCIFLLSVPTTLLRCRLDTYWLKKLWVKISGWNEPRLHPSSVCTHHLQSNPVPGTLAMQLSCSGACLLPMVNEVVTTSIQHSTDRAENHDTSGR